MNEGNDSSKHPIELQIPLRTYFLALLVIVGAYFFYLLAPLFLLVFISMLLGITLTSIERALMRRGWKKSIADGFLIITVLAVLSVVFFYLIPNAVTQMKDVMERLPKLQEQISQMASPMVRQGAGKLMQNSPGSLNRIWEQVGMIANHTLTGIFKFGVMMIVAFYMLIDGPKTYAWILAFFKPSTRKRLDATAQEIGPIVESYIIGQAITSTLAACWVFATASILGVPAALTLGVLAAVFDILPGLGFTLNALTGGLMALTVSPEKALFMVLSLLVYTLLENYLLVPYIYGNKLKLSPLVVLISIIVAGTLAGIPGMISILPIVAAYGPIERHWLKRHQEMEKTVALHQKLEGQSSQDLVDPYHN